MANLSEENIPTMEECQEKIESFVRLTDTDEALAQFYLQEKWNLETAINNYFEVKALKNKMSGTEMKTEDDNDDIIVTFDGNSVNVTTKPPDILKFLSWNIDGIDDTNLKKRMKAIVKTINIGKYDVVHLQEVTPIVQKFMQEHLPEYKFIASGDTDYYIATLLKLTTIHFDSKTIHKYPNSVMGRNLLEVEAHIGNVRFRFLNTHLESTKEFSEPRKVQLKNAFAQMIRGQKKKEVCILAGDLNIRNKEIQDVGIPHGCSDLWIDCGMPKECQFTWDLTRNTNKSLNSKFKPKFRFDRAFLYQSDCSVDAISFNLEGILKVDGTQKFPSDHWGIAIIFQIMDNSTIASKEMNVNNQMRYELVPIIPEKGVKDEDIDGDVIVLE